MNQVNQDVSLTQSNVETVHQQAQETLSTFARLSNQALAKGHLSKKTKALLALALGITSDSEPAIQTHMKALIQLGTSREEIEEVLGVLVYMNGSAPFHQASRIIGLYETLRFEDTPQATSSQESVPSSAKVEETIVPIVRHTSRFIPSVPNQDILEPEIKSEPYPNFDTTDFFEKEAGEPLKIFRSRF